MRLTTPGSSTSRIQPTSQTATGPDFDSRRFGRTEAEKKPLPILLLWPHSHRCRSAGIWAPHHRQSHRPLLARILYITRGTMPREDRRDSETDQVDVHHVPRGGLSLSLLRQDVFQLSFSFARRKSAQSVHRSLP